MDPPVGALTAIAALRADRRFDDFPIIASLSIDHIDCCPSKPCAVVVIA